MVFQKKENYSLNNFEGPLEFLLFLIQKEEINIHDISLFNLTEQFLKKLDEWGKKTLDTSAEFIGVVSYLVWLKSKSLLPSHEDVEESLPLELEEDPNFEIIYHLLDYSRFKDAAKELTKRQDQQSAYFFRGLAEQPEIKKPMGIDHISLDELSSLFKEMMQKASLTKPKIQEENWKVSDKIRSLKFILKANNQIELSALFTSDKSRLEWIVIFLAVLELMKMGEIAVGREVNSQKILIFSKESVLA